MSLSDMEKLIRAANRIARALEKANELQEEINGRMLDRIEEEEEEYQREAEQAMLARYDEELEGP